MKIGIIGTPLDQQYAGIHYFTKNLISELLNNDTTNEYYIFREKIVKEDFPAAKQVQIPTYGWLPGYKSYNLFRYIPQKAKELELDIVLEPAHFGPFNLPKSIKSITVIHDLTPLLFKQWHTFNGWFLQSLFLPKIVRNADLIITNSDYTKSDIVKHLNKNESQIAVTHLGISKIFKRTINKGILGKYGIYKDYILFQGTLEPRKNILKLIEAFEIFRDNHPKYKYQLILSGKRGWKVRDIIRKKYSSKYSDDIIILGYILRVDMPAIYSGAKVFAYPSFYEGFGLPVLEAMACETPVVTSNNSSLPEVGNKFALYCDPTEPLEIASKLAQGLLISDEVLQEGAKYAKSYSWTNTALKAIAAFESLS